jgi:hypothetical protein
LGRGRARRRAGRRAWAPLGAAGLAAGAAATLGGCDPCQNLAGCGSGAQHVSETMQVIEHATGRPVGGVRVTLVRTGGVPLERDSVSGVTGRDGMVTLRVGAEEGGTATVAVRVDPPPPWPAYRIADVEVRTYQARGDGGILGRWVVDPYVEYVGEVLDTRTGSGLGGARVSFRRRSGPAMVPDPVTDVSESGSGRFLWEPRVLEYGAVVGDVRVEHPSLPGGAVEFRDQPIQTQHIDRPPVVNGTFRVP